MSTGTRWVLNNPSDFQSFSENKRPFATLLWDHQGCLPLDRIHPGNKPVLLLTPVVVPPGDHDRNDNRDPFETLGQSIASRNIPVCHVPYTKNQGIAGHHVAFIKRARAIIFVITGFPDSDGPSQPEFAKLVARICDSQPLIVVACCDMTNRNLPTAILPTVIQATGYSTADLEVTAALLFDENPALMGPPSNALGQVNTECTWTVEPWNIDRDLVETHALWLACVPHKFHLSMSTLGGVLKRDGYVMHHIVREPTRGALVGFCATYTTFADSSDTDLIGSIAAIIVLPQYRGKGIGPILHDTAAGKLQSVRGVRRLQLGTTFPRLFCGFPIDMTPVAPWFKRRGWPVDGPGPGKDRLVADWVLRFSDLPSMTLASAGLMFRRCDETDIQEVWNLVNSQAAARHQCFGWYDQYARTLKSGKMNDIIVGFEGNTIVATAITYVPSQGGPTAEDIPWPVTLGPDIGGVTCVCIRDDGPEMVSRRDTVVVRLLHACCKTLNEGNMGGMFLDGVRFGESGLASLGFRKWAEYREVWRNV